MTDRKKKLPIGIDSFEKLRTDDFYYVDKTGLIADLLYNWSEVTLFTRPRRFGKTLNMSMLEAFFSPDSDKRIFKGLTITKETQLCNDYMGKYPVISISLKDIDAICYETAFALAVQIVNEAVYRVYPELKESKKLLPEERQLLSRYIQTDLTEAEFAASLRILSRLMEKHYSQKVIILIDEYDVPLAKANENGYYEQMISLIRNFFQQALKTNPSLKFAVLTGCMRISKESIFTGLNNLRVLTLSDPRLDEYFGFTDKEVRDMLAYYGYLDKYDDVRTWYDGYLFGRVNVYCPWDVINYCDLLAGSPDKEPQNFWMNSSGNTVIRKFLEHTGSAVVKGELERLINGETIEKKIIQELTYQDMYSSMENLWSVLFTTGYLTQEEDLGEGRFRLKIPNREIRNVFAGQILQYFQETVKKESPARDHFYECLLTFDSTGLEEALCGYLRRTISIRDTAVRKSMKENFYHGLLLGILSDKEGWDVASNQEAGDGYGDIILQADNYETAIILEIKYADDGDMDAICRKALQQIDEKHYADPLIEDGYQKIIKCGIACYKKRCRVLMGQSTSFPQQL